MLRLSPKSFPVRHTWRHSRHWDLQRTMSRRRLLDKSSKILKRLCEYLKVWMGFSIDIPWVHELIKPHKVFFFYNAGQHVNRTQVEAVTLILTKQEPRSLLTFFRLMRWNRTQGACFSKFRARKSNALVLKSWSFKCFSCKKNQKDFEIWRLRTSMLQRYKGNCGTRNRPEMFRDSWETGPWGRLF